MKSNGQYSFKDYLSTRYFTRNLKMFFSNLANGMKNSLIILNIHEIILYLFLLLIFLFLMEVKALIQLFQLHLFNLKYNMNYKSF